MSPGEDGTGRRRDPEITKLWAERVREAWLPDPSSFSRAGSIFFEIFRIPDRVPYSIRGRVWWRVIGSLEGALLGP